jgi:hypothetical protein
MQSGGAGTDHKARYEARGGLARRILTFRGIGQGFRVVRRNEQGIHPGARDGAAPGNVGRHDRFDRTPPPRAGSWAVPRIRD